MSNSSGRGYRGNTGDLYVIGNGSDLGFADGEMGLHGEHYAEESIAGY